MDYRILGSTGVKVSSLCFGTMSFGGDADEQTSAAMFNRCRDAGINFFDCANVYQKGRSEEILGELIKNCRDEVVITTKAYFPMGADVNARGAHRRHLMQAVEGSLIAAAQGAPEALKRPLFQHELVCDGGECSAHERIRLSERE